MRFSSEIVSYIAKTIHAMCACTRHSHAIPKMMPYCAPLQAAKLIEVSTPCMLLDTFNIWWLISLDSLFGSIIEHALTSARGSPNSRT